VALLALVGLASRTHVFGQGTPVPASVTRVTADTIFYLGVALVVLMLLIQLWALWPDPNSQITTPPRKRTIWDIIVPPISLLIAMAALWSIRSRLGELTGRRGAGLSAATPASLQAGLTQPGAPYFSGVDWLAIGIVVVTLGLAGGWVAYLLRPSKRRQHRRLPLAEQMSEVLDDAIDYLGDEPDPRQAVILAYARMERVLARSGLVRRPSEAPLEYMERVLSEMTSAEAPVRRLTELFEWAKFSQHPIDARMRSDAISALQAIRDELRSQDHQVGASALV
jgi:hypothetical protein